MLKRITIYFCWMESWRAPQTYLEPHPGMLGRCSAPGTYHWRCHHACSPHCIWTYRCLCFYSWKMVWQADRWTHMLPNFTVSISRTKRVSASSTPKPLLSMVNSQPTSYLPILVMLLQLLLPLLLLPQPPQLLPLTTFVCTIAIHIWSWQECSSYQCHLHAPGPARSRTLKTLLHQQDLESSLATST